MQNVGLVPGEGDDKGAERGESDCDPNSLN